MSSLPNSSSNTDEPSELTAESTPPVPPEAVAVASDAPAARDTESPFARVLRRHHDVRLQMSCELGGTAMRLRALLALTQGSVVVVDSPVGEDLRLRLNGVPFGHADVMVADSKVLLRLTEMCDGA